jgi:uncharacterized damage-inducible protein DinB
VIVMANLQTTEAHRIVDQLDRAFQGQSWHGPPVLDLLKDVDATRAAARPIAAAHSIWEIVLHMTTWKDVVRRRVQGEKPEVTDDWDWPPVTDTGAAAWRSALEALTAAHAALRDTASAVSDERLDQPAIPGGSTCYVQLHGVVQHDLYHAGQIAILKKG